MSQNQASRLASEALDQAKQRKKKKKLAPWSQAKENLESIDEWEKDAEDCCLRIGDDKKAHIAFGAERASHLLEIKLQNPSLDGSITVKKRKEWYDILTTHQNSRGHTIGVAYWGSWARLGTENGKAEAKLKQYRIFFDGMHGSKIRQHFGSWIRVEENPTYLNTKVGLKDFGYDYLHDLAWSNGQEELNSLDFMCEEVTLEIPKFEDLSDDVKSTIISARSKLIRERNQVIEWCRADTSIVPTWGDEIWFEKHLKSQSKQIDRFYKQLTQGHKARMTITLSVDGAKDGTTKVLCSKLPEGIVDPQAGAEQVDLVTRRLVDRDIWSRRFTCAELNS